LEAFDKKYSSWEKRKRTRVIAWKDESLNRHFLFITEGKSQGWRRETKKDETRKRAKTIHKS